jgi:hypothetical protein
MGVSAFDLTTETNGPAVKAVFDAAVLLVGHGKSKTPATGPPQDSTDDNPF